MADLIIHRKRFVKLISSARVQRSVSLMAARMNRDLRNECPVFLSVLNGSFLFTADLLKKLKIECEVSFIKVASYRGSRSSGKVSTLIGLQGNFERRTVVILEDIVDSGKTLAEVVKALNKRRPKQIKVAALFFKPAAYRGKIKIDYTGMQVPDRFLLGYGLDYNGLGRNLQDVYILDL